MNVDLMNNMSNNEKTNKTNPKLEVKVITSNHKLLGQAMSY